jgi:hypothetical protein
MLISPRKYIEQLGQFVNASVTDKSVDGLREHRR